MVRKFSHTIHRKHDFEKSSELSANLRKDKALRKQNKATSVYFCKKRFPASAGLLGKF